MNTQKSIIRILNAKINIALSSVKVMKNHNRASDPKTLVTTNCPIEPTLIASAPIIRFLGERKNTLPPYSPIRFGVNTAHVKPQKTDSTDFQVLIFSKSLTKNFHFRDSKNQFNNIKENKLSMTRMTLTKEIELINDLKLLIFWLSLSFLKMNKKAIMITLTFIPTLKIFFVRDFMLMQC